MSLPREEAIDKWRAALEKNPAYRRVKFRRQRSREDKPGGKWDDRVIVSGRGGLQWSLNTAYTLAQDPPPSMVPHRIEVKQRHTRGHTEWVVEFLSNRVASAQRVRWLQKYKEKEPRA